MSFGQYVCHTSLYMAWIHVFFSFLLIYIYTLSHRSQSWWWSLHSWNVRKKFAKSKNIRISAYDILWTLINIAPKIPDSSNDLEVTRFYFLRPCFIFNSYSILHILSKNPSGMIPVSLMWFREMLDLISVREHASTLILGAL